MSATAARTFTLSRSLRLVAAVQFAVLLVLLAVAFAGDRQLSTREAGLLWILFAVLAFWVNLELNATRVTLDAEGVAIHRGFGFWRRFRLTRGAILAYLGGVATVLIGPLLFAVSGFAALKLLFTVSLGLLSPFFLRDWRRAHGVLRLELDRMEGINGRSVLVMPWRAIAQLIIRDLGCGLGWVIVVDRRRIRIPRSSRECGAIRHLLAQRVGLAKDFAQEQW